MAQLKIYRCWYFDGSMRLVSAKDHSTAALEAQELAGIANADMPKSSPEERRDWLVASKVKRTECLAEGDRTEKFYRLGKESAVGIPATPAKQ